jgi:hypothetical protein
VLSHHTPHELWCHGDESGRRTCGENQHTKDITVSMAAPTYTQSKRQQTYRGGHDYVGLDKKLVKLARWLDTKVL